MEERICLRAKEETLLDYIKILRNGQDGNSLCQRTRMDEVHKIAISS